jgi:hypothetical protein
LPGQSDFSTHLKVASGTVMPAIVIVGHVALAAMQVPAPNWSMQQMWLLRSHGVPQMGVPASSNCTLLGTRPDPPLLVLPPESGCAPPDDVDDVDPELVLDPESGVPLEDPDASSPKPPPLPPVPHADRPAVTIVLVTRNTRETWRARGMLMAGDGCPSGETGVRVNLASTKARGPDDLTATCDDVARALAARPRSRQARSRGVA